MPFFHFSSLFNKRLWRMRWGPVVLRLPYWHFHLRNILTRLHSNSSPIKYVPRVCRLLKVRLLNPITFARTVSLYVLRLSSSRLLTSASRFVIGGYFAGKHRLEIKILDEDYVHVAAFASDSGIANWTRINIVGRCKRRRRVRCFSLEEYVNKWQLDVIVNHIINDFIKSICDKEWFTLRPIDEIRAVSIVPSCLIVDWMSLSRKCKKVGQTRRILLEEGETFLAVLPRFSLEERRGCLYFSPWPPGLLSITSFLPAAEIECREEGCLGRRGADWGVLWKRKDTSDRRHYLPKLGSDATVSAQRLHKERLEVCHRWILYTRADIRHPSRDSIALALMTRDYY